MGLWKSRPTNATIAAKWGEPRQYVADCKAGVLRDAEGSAYAIRKMGRSGLTRIAPVNTKPRCCSQNPVC